MSRPARGAWVEIDLAVGRKTIVYWSRPARGAWVEIPRGNSRCGRRESRPARGAWVEINFEGDV